MKRACLTCGALFSGGRPRCPGCQRGHDRARRPSPEARYGADRKQRHRAAIESEPWCHWEGGCQYPDAGSHLNPLAADHPTPVARGGAATQPLVVLCRRHNSGKGAGGGR